MSIRSGYEAIPNPAETEPILNPSVSSVSNEDVPFLQRVKQFDYRSYYHKHGLSAILISCILLFIFLLLGLATFLPSIHHQSSKIGILQPPINPGISSFSLHQGLTKCREFNKAIIDNVNNSKRSINPRAPKDIQPIVLRNAVVWDGQGEILNNVDILMTNGVISEVKQNIQAPASAKIIDVGGHIVSPGLVDMHT